MALTVFYSWQSDLDARVTRQLIRESLNAALTLVNAQLGVDDAARLDQDTQGVPGMPDIVTTILAKIDGCAVFVPDLSLVAVAPNGSRSPNPNVLLELGYALRAKSDRQIVPVMNESFGAASELPFDLARRRWPLRFSLAEGADLSSFRETRERLTSALADAIRAVISAAEEPPQSQRYEPLSPVHRSSSFLADGEVLVRETDAFADGPPEPVLWRNGPQLFLRVFPEAPAEPRLPSQELLRAARTTPPLGRVIGFQVERNKYGAVSYAVPKTSPEETRVAVILTQLFGAGEIWGINGMTLVKNPDRPYVPTGVVIEVLTNNLAAYMKCMADHFRAVPPLRFIVGLSGIEGYQLAMPRGYGSEFAGTCYQEEVVVQGTVSSYAETPAQLLDPFFEALHAAFGVEQPPKAATG